MNGIRYCSLQLNAVAVDKNGAADSLTSLQARIEITVIRNEECPIFVNVPAIPPINESRTLQSLITLSDYVQDGDSDVSSSVTV